MAVEDNGIIVPDKFWLLTSNIAILVTRKKWNAECEKESEMICVRWKVL